MLYNVSIVLEEKRKLNDLETFQYDITMCYVILALRAGREAREEYSLHQSDTIRSFQLYQFQ